MSGSRAEHFACHAAHVRDWPLHAKVWIWWGASGWIPGVVTGHTKYRVRCRIDPLVRNGVMIRVASWRSWSYPAPNSLRPRRSDTDMPPAKRVDETCLAMTGGVA